MTKEDVGREDCFPRTVQGHIRHFRPDIRPPTFTPCNIYMGDINPDIFLVLGWLSATKLSFFLGGRGGVFHGPFTGRIRQVYSCGVQARQNNGTQKQKVRCYIMAKSISTQSKRFVRENNKNELSALWIFRHF